MKRQVAKTNFNEARDRFWIVPGKPESDEEWRAKLERTSRGEYDE